MSAKKQEAHRALELLEEYRSKLNEPDERPLREAIERLIMIFKSRLFQALLDIQEFYQQTLLNETKSLSQKTDETNVMADHWEKNPPVQGFSNGDGKQKKRAHKHYNIKTDVTIVRSSGIRCQPIIPPAAPLTCTQESGRKANNGRMEKEKPYRANHGDRDHDNVSNIAASADWEYEDISMERTSAGLGFSIAGGNDHPRFANDPSIYVSKIIPGGAAEANGRLKKEDIIVRVDDTDFSNVSHKMAVETLKKAGRHVRLGVRRRRESRPEKARRSIGPYEQIQRFELNKGTSGLGFSIAGGVGNEHTPGDSSIFITKIIDGGAAQMDGRLKVNDKILAVGNTRFENITHETAVAALKAAPDRVVLTIAKATRSILPQQLDQSYTNSDTLPMSDGKVHRPPAAVSAPVTTPPVVPAVPTPIDHVAPNQRPGEVTRAPRRITLTKGPAGLGFNIVGGEDGAGIYISYIVPGGVADYSGLVLRGDQLLAVNTTDLCDATHEQAASALKNSGQTVNLVLQHRPEAYARFEEKLRQLREEYTHQGGGGLQKSRSPMPYLQVQPVPKRELYVRALFDYDPTKDSGLPSRGLAFNYSDVLHVTNASDDEWWQARKIVKDGVEEGVEKKERARRKQVNFGAPVTLDKTGKRSLALVRKFPFMKSKDRLNEDGDLEKPEEPIFSYEVVERVQINYARPVIVSGPMKDRINDDLLAEFPDRFAACVPHTSRPRRDNETDGREYHFVSRQQMEQDIASHRFIEAGQYKENLYGTSVDAIRTVADRGKHCILDVSLKAVKRLRAASVHPIVVLVKPYSSNQLCEWNRRLTNEEAEAEYQGCIQSEQGFADSITATVQGDTPEEIYSRVKDVIRDQSSPLVWVPSSEQLQS